ncbi:enolase C-terminal domain-like protein [Saliphagus infecundisoli]|uniref:Enolase C-terminal domain-like protein n=1 Tax=Saliphagus infecundisoli TaxID=1849069 RepID=A0ABD5QAE0_9EURY|nr:enolase C-terminal domain-like protein [Saliphagus infecundisoli]
MIEVTRTDQYVRNNEKRMPFHFGNVVASEGAHHFLEIELEIDGECADGISMVGIAPLWFLKDPDRSLPEQNELLIEVFEAACEHARAVEAQPTAFDLWHSLYERQAEWAEGNEQPPLLWNYGVSMVEQAIVDAVCRHEETTFAEGLRSDALGVEPGRIYDELAGEDVAEYLPDESTREAAVRHTVGLGDPLREGEIASDDRLDDGLPQSLEAYVAEDGVDHFKIKLSADPDRDAERLARIEEVLEESPLESWFCTVDANEGYDSVEAFREQWERHASDPDLAPVMDAVAYVEQPLPRSEALTDGTREVLTDWDGRPPIIIDESDDRLTSAGRALECGYAGTSHKNCKGVFKGVVNACLIEKRRREGDREYVMSGEDLTTIGPVELLHDLAVMGSLGMDHVERNGHHYYRGLSFLPEDLQETLRDAHGDLYRRHEEGFATLDIDDGRMSFGSAVDAPFGRDFDLDPSRFTPLAEWSTDSMYD